jgi:hypothetical protein
MFFKFTDDMAGRYSFEDSDRSVYTTYSIIGCLA